MPTREHLRRLAATIIFDDYIDLYLLAAVSLAVAILGAAGVADIKILASAILALLAALAFSQIRSRRGVSEIIGAQQQSPLSMFKAAFPPDMESRRASASTLLLIGLSMSRTVQGVSSAGLRTILNSGGRIRVLLLDPENAELMRAASRYRSHSATPDALKKRIKGSLEEFKDLSAGTKGNVEIRVTSFIPQMSVNAINIGRRSGLVVIQHYEYRPAGEPAPIFLLEPADAPWFEHFAREAERMWADGIPWPNTALQGMSGLNYALSHGNRPLGAPMRALLVENDENWTCALVAALRQAGASDVVACQDLKMVNDALRRARFDIAVLEIGLAPC